MARFVAFQLKYLNYKDKTTIVYAPIRCHFYMKNIKSLILIIFISLSFINFSHSETVNFSVGTWEGDVKKGKAHGKGVLTFNTGLVYEGKMSKNRIHGVGKLTTQDGEVYEGKWKYGKFYEKINKKTRKVVELSTKGRFFWIRHEVRGTGSVSSKWFPAEEKSGSYVLSAAGKRKMEEAITAKEKDNSGGAAC